MVRSAVASLLCITLALPGCASARLSRAGLVPRQSAASPTDPATMAEYVRKLPVGSKVRVDTVHGRTLRGTLMKATDEELVVQRNTRLPESPEAIPMKDVARVTLETGGSSGKLMGIGAAIGAGAAVGVIWLIVVLAFGD